MFSHDRECRFKPAAVSGYHVGDEIGFLSEGETGKAKQDDARVHLTLLKDESAEVLVVGE